MLISGCKKIREKLSFVHLNFTFSVDTIFVSASEINSTFLMVILFTSVVGIDFGCGFGCGWSTTAEPLFSKSSFFLAFQQENYTMQENSENRQSNLKCWTLKQKPIQSAEKSQK